MKVSAQLLAFFLITVETNVIVFAHADKRKTSFEESTFSCVLFYRYFTKERGHTYSVASVSVYL